MKKEIDINECFAWCKQSPLLINYHNHKWCKPIHDDNELFAYLILEIFSSGLSWEIVLKKEKYFRQYFDNLNPHKCALYVESDIARFMKNEGLIHHFSKLKALINNAQKFILIQNEFGSFDRYIWGFTHGKTIDHKRRNLKEIPAKDQLSSQISRDLKRRGFKFVGPVIIYSYLQAIGVINDHLINCQYR